MSDQPDDGPAASETGPTPTEEHHDWVAAVLGIDPRKVGAAPNVADAGGVDTPAVAAAMPAPTPGTIEVIEEAVVSGVRLIAPAVGGAEAGGTAGAAAAGAGAGALVMGGVVVGGLVAGAALAVGIPYLFSHGEEVDQRADPDEQNLPGGAPAGTGTGDDPDGGAPSASGGSKPQRGTKPALPPPVPGVDYDSDDPPATPTCRTQFPRFTLCSETTRERYDTPDEAIAKEPNRDWKRYTTDTMEEFDDLPDSENNHRTYYDEKDDKLFSLVKIPCCTDTPAGPVLTWRWSSAN